MPNRQYEKGVRFERKVMEDLAGSDDSSGLGYSVMRAAGSKGRTKIDIIAFHPTLPMMLIQAKENAQISACEWNQVFEVSRWYPDGVCVPVLAVNGLKGSGVRYYRLLGERVLYSRTQPYRIYFPCCGDHGFNPAESLVPYRHTDADHTKIKA